MSLIETTNQRLKWLIGFILLAWVEFATATDYYVASSGTDTPNCGTNNNMCATLLYALNRTQDGDRIVFNGTLRGSGNVNISLTKSISIVSLDNIPQNNAIDCEGIQRGFVIVNTSSVLNIIFEGFTIRSCTLPTNRSTDLPNPNPMYFGAAFSVFNAPNVNIAFNNMIFENHIAYGGAAVYIFQNSSYQSPTVVHFDNSIVRYCQSGVGSILVTNAKISIRNSVIANNTLFQLNESFGDGGGIALIKSATALISNAIFHDNIAVNGGALYLDEGSYAEVNDSSFINNVATQGGAAFLFQSFLKMTRTNVTGNSASLGGGVVAYFSSVQSLNSLFMSNTATLRGGAYLLSENAGSMTVSTQIINNSATYGGGICVQFQGKVNITDSVISENRAYSGGGLYISTGNWVNLTTTQVTKNYASSSGGGIFCSDSELVLSFALISENTGPLDQTNNNLYCSPNPIGTFCDIRGDVQWAGLCQSVIPGSSDLIPSQVVWIIVGVIAAVLAAAFVIVVTVISCKRINKIRPANIEDKHKHVWTALDDEGSGGVESSRDVETTPSQDSPRENVNQRRDVSEDAESSRQEDISNQGK